MKKSPSISQFGDHGLIIRYSDEIDYKIHLQLDTVTNKVLKKFKKYIEGYSIAYQESAIYFHPEFKIEKKIKKITQFITDIVPQEILEDQKEIIQIPVCYEKPFALDIDELAQEKQIETSKIIDLHTSPIYPVYFIGFAPGFPYLGGMDKQLSFPRKASPRKSVAAGSVGIAGNQTGVYPNASPGGWNIIGRSPLCFFDVTKTQPSLLQAGDLIQFRSIDKKTFDHIEKQVELGQYSLEKIANND
ncbi:5-oxoprolinase subunit PxpB [Brumimicrobium aurantiacum]|uniref:5-oxoprolinase subunit PxpB n=1 Tax=Brumimicrobium aurantiacum TaxID=1737063 RepID=A0A3E1EXG4_9FLAO|nr:5-oxoprolinase subunit PxpB [Brumimicrobium aurantiacum]RFC54228.1 5-oxoprolinase subunit PxpB [Brumimicrobium aurantiacum]